MNYSMGLFVYYFGSKKNIIISPIILFNFGNSYQDHLKKIFEDKILTDDISYYLHRPQQLILVWLLKIMMLFTSLCQFQIICLVLIGKKRR